MTMKAELMKRSKPEHLAGLNQDGEGEGEGGDAEQNMGEDEGEQEVVLCNNKYIVFIHAKKYKSCGEY